MGAAVTNPWCTAIEKHLPTPLQTVSNPTSHIHKFLHEGAQGIVTRIHRFFTHSCEKFEMESQGSRLV